MIGINNVKSKLKKPKLPPVFSKSKLSAILLLSLIILAMLASFYLAYSIPSFSKTGMPAEPGRPTWRTVSGDEVSIVEYINASSNGENYAVLAQGYFPELVAGMLGYRYFGNQCNLALGAGLVDDNYYNLMFDPSPSLIYETMVGTNSSVAFFVTEDWYIEQYSMPLSNLQELQSFASEYKVYGSSYKFYVFKFDYDIITNLMLQYIHPIDEYEVHSPIIIAEDEAPSFWSVIPSYGSGNMGTPSIDYYNQTTLSGNYSLGVVIGRGDYGTVGIVHSYSSYQNWSGEGHICFFFYGEDSLASVTVYIGAPTSNDAMSFTFTDIFVGWRWLEIPFNAFSAVRGSPDLAQVGALSFSFEDAQGTSFLIDQIYLDS